MIISNGKEKYYLNEKDVICFQYLKSNPFTYLTIYLNNKSDPVSIAFIEDEKSEKLIAKLQQLVDDQNQEIFELEKPY